MPSTKPAIEFDHLGIGTALSRNRFRVPLNQREYSWEEKHVLDLLQDFSKAIDAQKKAYFLGTIVLTTTEDDSLEVIDGQQRLATATILIAAIRDFLLTHKDEMLVNSTEQDFLFKVVRKKREMAPRLTLNTQDKDYFIKRILARPAEQDRKKTKPTKLSHERMETAARLAAEHVQKIVSPHKKANQANVLNSWLDFMENSAQIITLVVPDDLNAYVMFETLNDRGLTISQSDLLKNYLFGEANGRLADAQTKWSGMTGLLEALGDEDIVLTYLRHLAISMYGHTREKEVFEKIKERVVGERGALDFLDALADNANNYIAMMTPTHAKWNQFAPNTRGRLHSLLTLRVAALRPLLLSIIRKFPKK